MGRLDLSGTQKLPGQMGDGSVIRCDAPQPEVQFTVDGGVTVMKRDGINLTRRGRKHRQTLINIIRCLLVQQSLHFYTDGGNLERMELTGILYEGNMPPLCILKCRNHL